jgi:alkanesulfonate monooxygenase SsuD/methylene tetrahydromethanopterin reductase-like flavin-dependent oxidoreductase (luciferase family)
MVRKISIGINWQGPLDYKALLEKVQIADTVGVHSAWVPEAWGRDAFTTLALLADRTKNIQLGTAIVNTYSRTPAALAQHFATLDELSGGRMLIGLGTSGPQVIGKLFNLQRGFTLRFTPVRNHIPIYLATLNAKSVKLTAELADGWLPIMIPLPKLSSEISAVRQLSVAAGRPANAVSVRAPGAVVVTKNTDKARAESAGTLAFYIGRMGTFYAEQLTRHGYGEAVQTVKKAWESGSRAAAEAVPNALIDATSCAGSVEVCIDRLQAQEERGVDIHTVHVDAQDAREYEQALARLVG